MDRRAFFPSPKVDSAVARIDMHNKYADKNIPKILRLIKIAFSMRRKTLINNLAAATNISKDRLRKELIDCGFDERIRGEVLSLEDFIFYRKNWILLCNFFRFLSVFEPWVGKKQ